MNDENHYTAPDGKRYVAVKTPYNNPSCEGCAFWDVEKSCLIPKPCGNVTRQDRRNIIWKLETKETK